MSIHEPRDYTDDRYAKFAHGVHVMALENGTSPLLNKNIEREMPYDPVTGVVHEGVNGFVLDNVSAIKNYKDPRWIRSYEAEKLGYKPKYGEKATVIAYRNRYNDPAGKSESVNNYYYVYNAEQIRNFPARELSPEMKVARKRERADKRKTAMENSKGFGNPFHKLAAMVNQEVHQLKETAFAISTYRFSQDVGLKTHPIKNKAVLLEEANKEGYKAVLKSMYEGSNQSRKIRNEGLSVVPKRDQTRQQRVEQSRVEKKFQQPALSLAD